MIKKCYFKSGEIRVKNLIKKVLLWYIVITYKLAIKPSKFITSFFPGNSGYTFSSNYESISDSKFILSQSTEGSHYFLTEDKEYNIPEQDSFLADKRSIIFRSGKAHYKYHLNAMYDGLKELLEDLGIGTRIMGYEQLSNELLSKHFFSPFDYIVIDNEITPSEFQQIQILLTKRFSSANKWPLILLVCYDLWRESDLDLINEISPYLHSILHMDPVYVEKYFSEKLKQKSFLWPVARFWLEAQRVDSKKNKMRETIFFSGSVRQIDRREILDSVLCQLKNSRLRSNFQVFDTLVPRSISSKDKYLTELNSNEFVLALGQKTTDHWIMTGRTVEALVSPRGGVLIQQEGPNCKPLGTVLSPFNQYLPFVTNKDLHEIITFASTHPNEMGRIARAGQKRILETFSSLNLAKAFYQL